MILKVIFLILISFFNFALWFEDYHSIESISFYLPLISIIFSIVFVLSKIKNRRVEFKVYYLFIAGVVYFNAPLYFKALFNTQEALNDLLFYNIKLEYFIKSNYLLGLSLPLISAGYIFKTNVLKDYKHKSKKHYYTPSISESENIKVYVIFTIIFLILSISITGFTVGSTYIGTSSYFYILVIRMINLVGVMLIFNRLASNNFSFQLSSLNKVEITSLFTILIFIIYVLIGGDRGPAFVIMLILAFGYLLMNKMTLRVKDLLLGSLFIVLIYMLFSFISVLRLTGDDVFNKEIIHEALINYEDHSPTLGLQVRTTSAAIEGIEKNLYPHTYGQFFIQSMIKSIPYIGNKITNSFFYNTSIYKDGTASLITTQISGVDYASGLGTSYLADTFIEFGLFGVIVFSFLYGLMIGNFEVNIKTMSFKSFSSFLLVTLFIGDSFSVGRGTLYRFLVNFVHTWIIYILVKHIFIKPFKKE